MVPTLALALLLAAAPPTGSAPLEALILGGGKTAAEAERWLGHWRAAAPAIQEFYAPAEGFPKVVESATLAGLKPGFHVVVLGFCPAAQAGLPHLFAKGLFPGTYTKPVTGPSAACPVVSPKHRFEEAQGAGQGSFRIAVLRLTPLGPDRDGSVVLPFFLFQDERLVRSGTAQHLAESRQGLDARYGATLRATKTTVQATITETRKAGGQPETRRTLTEFGFADGEFDIRELPAP